MFSTIYRIPSLMPAIALAALSALVALPTLSSSMLHAATPTHFARVTVQAGDALWSIAARYTKDGDSIDDTLDQIRAVNHLNSTTVRPGETLRIPL
ncbi:MAG TPA: LysM peptidoglycan-binding domain-containing protein [Candidatus Baltobacteraceae bacterium]|jgi:predicted Zn-dependent protease|nr:LysM peptidoglycan-binding domain-containing protein [Candidatus Baltobacteraceae bacterium]